MHFIGKVFLVTFRPKAYSFRASFGEIRQGGDSIKYSHREFVTPKRHFFTRNDVF